MSDPWSLRAAAFVIQVLELDVSAEELAAGMSPLKREPGSGITAVELSSAAGSTPFLVYHYVVTGGAGDRFRDDIATMERAATLNTPGPRIVVSATTDDEAFILATTPSVQRFLAGETAQPAAIPHDVATADRVRRETPGRLIEAIRTANDLAGEWLGALRASAAEGDEADLTFTDEEAALALYLLDDQSAGDLLRALNLALSAARGSIAPPRT